MKSPASLTVSQLRKTFGPTEVLKGVDIQFAAGEITGVIGKNGSGKTTLFRCLTCQTTIDSGHVAYANRVLPRETPWSRARRGFGWTFQEVSMPLTLSVKDLIALSEERAPALPRGSQRPEYSELADATAQFQAEPWSSLSFGQRKLAALQIALVRSPSVLFLDEPVAGVSQGLANIVGRTLRAAADKGSSIAIVEHSRQFLLEVADRIAVLSRGQILFDGDPATAFADPGVRDALI